MDYLQAGWSPHLIRDEFNLTDKQMNDVMEYIETHREEVEKEYQAVLQEAEKNRQYWEARNRERQKHIARTPPNQGKKRFAPNYKLRRRGLAWREYNSR